MGARGRPPARARPLAPLSLAVRLAAEPAKGHSALRTAVDLRLAQSTYDVLLARARAAGLFDSTYRGYGPGQNPPAGAGHAMSLAISA